MAKKSTTKTTRARRSPSPKKKARRKRGKVIEITIFSALGIFLILSLSIILMVQHFGPAKQYGAKVPEGNWRFGIDISHNNEGPVVWDSLFVMLDSRRHTIRDPYKARVIKPVSFVYIKATEGATFIDCDFKENWSNAGHANIRRGAYHFFRSSKDGEIQARNFISTVGKMRTEDLPPGLDIETIHKGCTKKLLNNRALQWLNAVRKEYGKTPIVYASSSFIKDYLCEEITSNYPIWVAHYEKSEPDWKEWEIWQTTDKAIVSGIKGYVDLDVMPTGARKESLLLSNDKDEPCTPAAR